MAPNTSLIAQPLTEEAEMPGKPDVDVFRPKTASMKWNDADLKGRIEECAKSGILIVEDLGVGVSFDQIGSLLEKLHSDPSLGARANAAYTKNLVYKDSTLQGKGGPNVDEKRVLDVSEERLLEIEKNDKNWRSDLGTDFEQSLKFANDLDADVQRLLKILASVIGDPALFEPGSTRRNFRMVDYVARLREIEAPRPRCGEHRDFGPMTLIFQDGRRGSDAGGLQVHLDGLWRDVPVPKAANSAILLFGICTAWRSNDRINAVKHRVVNQPSDVDGPVKRRLSAVLFVGPKEEETLAPLLADGEMPKWKTGLVKDVRQFVARKWKHREGTVTAEEALAEEDLKKHLPTQDDAIEHYYKVPN